MLKGKVLVLAATAFLVLGAIGFFYIQFSGLRSELSLPTSQVNAAPATNTPQFNSPLITNTSTWNLSSTTTSLPKILVTPTPQKAKLLGLSLGSISLSMRSKDVVKNLGIPTEKTITHGIGTPEWYYSIVYTISITDPTNSVNPDSVWQINVDNPSLKAATSEGIHIGDTKKTFELIYAGFDFRKCANCQHTQITVLDDSGTNLDVWFDASNKIIFIGLTKSKFN